MLQNKQLTFAEIIRGIVRRVTVEGQFELQCEISRLGPLFSVSLFNRFEDLSVISERVFSGMDLDQDRAILKACVEMVERMAFDFGHWQGAPICQTERSDGFAAFPRIQGVDAASIARANAYHEAVERFAWATWWDEDNIAADYERGEGVLASKEAAAILLAIKEIVAVKGLYLIRPKMQQDLDLQIYFVEIEGGGLISGGACGLIGEKNATQVRALGELARHAVAVRKIKEGRTPKTFYEQRLAFMMQDGAVDLLRQKGERQSDYATIHLPNLKFDSAVNHQLEDMVVVHRCLFQGQPEFIGGKLERLCL